MRFFAVIVFAFALNACSSGIKDDLPPVEAAGGDSLSQPQPDLVIPSEEGEAQRNPDDPFLMAKIGDDLRIGELHAGGVMARNPTIGGCASLLQRYQSAKLPLEIVPDECVLVDLRLFGPGSENVIIPDPPEPEGEDVEGEDGFWDDFWSSIFG